MNRTIFLFLTCALCCFLTSGALADPPENDSCAYATMIDDGILNPGETMTFTGSNVDATSDCEDVGDPEVWIKFTIEECMDVNIDYCGTDPVMYSVSRYLYDSCPCGEDFRKDNSYFCEDDNRGNAWEGLEAGTYWYPVIVGEGSEGSYNINVSGEACPEAPANDNCADAISVGEVTDLEYTTRGGTFDGEGTCMDDYYPNIWYVYTASSTGYVQVSLVNDDGGKFAMYDGSTCSPLPDELACSFSMVNNIAVIQGEQYLIEIGEGDNYSSGTITIREQSNSGACCYQSEEFTECVETNEETCNDEYEGTWMGYGTECGEFNEETGSYEGCQELVIGACCYEEGYACVEIDEETCYNEYEGTWMGAGVECGEYSEETGYEGCQEPTTGACCYQVEITSCIETDEETCYNEYDGTWMGADTECTDGDENGIADICEEPSTGACCYQVEETTNCIETDAETCYGEYDGTWMGSGTDCTDADENGIADACEEPPAGACCYEEGYGCEVTDEATCYSEYEGTWMGAGVECGEYNEETGYEGCQEPPTGACCYEEGYGCEVTDEATCYSEYEGTWMGAGVECGEFNEESGWSGCGDTPIYEYLPGDANMAAEAWPAQTIGGDVTYLVNYFRGLADPCKLTGFYASADANGDCMVVGGDVTYLVNYFRGLNELSHCTNYEPAWPTPSDVPAEAPEGWPNCD